MRTIDAVVDHVGIAVPEIERAASLYAVGFGRTVSPVKRMPDQGIAVTLSRCVPSASS